MVTVTSLHSNAVKINVSITNFRSFTEKNIKFYKYHLFTESLVYRKKTWFLERPDNIIRLRLFNVELFLQSMYVYSAVNIYRSVFFFFSVGVLRKLFVQDRMFLKGRVRGWGGGKDELFDRKKNYIYICYNVNSTTTGPGRRTMGKWMHTGSESTRLSTAAYILLLCVSRIHVGFIAPSKVVFVML